MSQIIKNFSISAASNKSKTPIHLQLIERINKFANENNYKIVTLSHNIHWYPQHGSWGGHAIVVFEPKENNHNTILLE